MRNAFIDAATGVLKAFGSVASNEPGDGVVAVPEDFVGVPGAMAYRNGAWVAYTPPPTADQVVAERGRRLALGFNYTFPNADPRGTVRIGTTAADMAGWSEVSEWSRTKLALGQTAATLQIVTNSGPVTVSPMEWQGILDAGTAFRQPIWAASFMLQAQNPVPLDYATDAHWPAVQ